MLGGVSAGAVSLPALSAMGSLQLDVPGWLVPAVAVVIASLLLSVLVLTVGFSVVRARGRRRRDAVRGDLQGELLDRLYGSGDPAWADWAGSLADRERSVLEELLEEYLRELDGADARRLTGLGEALGIDERARRRLESGGLYARLDALTWLGLLRDPPAVSALETHCTGTPRERAAAARVLYLSGRDDVASVGVELLLGDSPGAFSVFGIDTLYRLAEADPGPLFSRAAADYADWEPALQAQVLLVCRQLNTVVGGADLSWVLELTGSPEERTRIEAIRTLGGYGWRRSLRERVDLEALTSDPSPAVRASTYRTLEEWGDEEATDALLAAASTEPDERARVAAARALVDRLDGDRDAVPASLTAAWSWAAEHATFDRRARAVPSTGGQDAGRG